MYQKKYPIFQRVRFFSPAGEQKFASGKAAGVPEAKKIFASSWFQSALQSKETIFSDVLKGDEFKEPTMLMARAALDAQDKPFAVVVAEIPAGKFTMPVNTIKIGRAGYAFIINKDGFVVAHPDKTNVLQLNLNDYPFGKEMLQRKRGHIEYAWKGGATYASFAEYAKSNWIVAASVPKGDILDSVNRMGYVFGMLVLASGLASFLRAVVSAQPHRPPPKIFLT